MRSGKLRHRLEVMSATESANGFGEPSKSWTTDTTVWGSVEPLNGRELVESAQVKGEVTHRITIRYLAGLTPKKRFRFDSRLFEIVAGPFNVEERDREIFCLCRERT